MYLPIWFGVRCHCSSNFVKFFHKNYDKNNINFFILFSLFIIVFIILFSFYHWSVIGPGGERVARFTSMVKAISVDNYSKKLVESFNPEQKISSLFFLSVRREQIHRLVLFIFFLYLRSHIYSLFFFAIWSLEFKIFN